MPMTMRAKRRRLAHARGLDHGARPQRVGALLDDLAVDLLSAQPRAGVAADHRVEKGGREKRGVGAGRGARHRGARVGGEPLDQRDRPRRGGDELARARPQPQAELQHVEGGVRVRPLGELVAPGGVELRPAQLLGVFRREGERHRAVRPFEALPRRRPLRPLAARPRRSRPGRPLDHHLAHVAPGLADQREIARAARRHRAEGRAPARARHSAPARVLPAPRPPSISQVVHGPPLLAAARRLLVAMRQRDEVAVKPQPLARVRHLRLHREAQSGLR